jgi:hypothetical protein
MGLDDSLQAGDAPALNAPSSPDPVPFHLDRARASAFGPIALLYDRFRPPYPQALIDDLVSLLPSHQPFVHAAAVLH